MEPTDAERAKKILKNFPNLEFRKKKPALLRYAEDHKLEAVDSIDVLYADPRFPSRRGDARCYQMFIDKLKCQRKHGTEPGTVCDYFVKRLPMVCPPSRIERWEEALESGKLFRV